MHTEYAQVNPCSLKNSKVSVNTRYINKKLWYNMREQLLIVLIQMLKDFKKYNSHQKSRKISQSSNFSLYVCVMCFCLGIRVESSGSDGVCSLVHMCGDGYKEGTQGWTWEGTCHVLSFISSFVHNRRYVHDRCQEISQAIFWKKQSSWERLRE